jgi:hypothetical protein
MIFAGSDEMITGSAISRRLVTIMHNATDIDDNEYNYRMGILTKDLVESY